MGTVRVESIIDESYVDGPGKRAVVFFRGCSHLCKGCQSSALWDRDSGGFDIDTRVLATLLRRMSDRVTISGGEPFQQPDGLQDVLEELKVSGVDDVQVYTGYTYEEILNDHAALLQSISTLVDGRYIQALDDDLLSWRGSRNQRVIDVQASLKTGHVITRDWGEDDSVSITLDETGDIHVPAGVCGVLDSMGDVTPSRICGEVTKLCT